jgi:hypothetical protein
VNLPDTKELKKLVAFLRKEGISHLKSGDFEMSLSAAALFPKKPGKEKPTENVPVEGEYSPEDALFWSSAGLGGGN